ncbi:MAG: OmpA family protein [Candidatus Omnitrophota bacterium]|jgi:outer membrane protein OmpA-like peptidoglycan-associated protein|nr:MAG: OmpA family protein [Candidatus Omnitrophota bacterium]
MNRFLIGLLMFSCFLNCQSSTERGLIRLEGAPVEASVRAPFEQMIENARQPDLVLGAVYFDFDDSRLTDESKGILDRISHVINERSGKVIVEGHADHVNTDSFNKRLGYKRAFEVAQYLKSAGVWDERLMIRSHGENRPIATNWSDEGRAENRRVVIKIFAQGEGMSGTDASRVMKAKQTSQKEAGKSAKSQLMLSVDENTEE